MLKKHPRLDGRLRSVLEQLADDAFHQSLGTHKLSGDMEGFWSSEVAYDLRVIFTFVDSEGSEAILLQTIGTHDEVY